MKRVGDLLRQARSIKGLSYKDLEELTHIRASFIQAVENSDWEKLPESNIVLGFVKSLSHFLDVDEREAVALFRREYAPSKKQAVRIEGAKNDGSLNKRFILGPRVTFLLGVSIVILIVLVYLGFQYNKFNSPPSLFVNVPIEGQAVKTHTLEVNGKTDPDATVTINNQSALVDNEGNFNTTVEINENTKEIVVEVENRAGKTTTISRTIIFTPE